jgi:hypothetical protein
MLKDEIKKKLIKKNWTNQVNLPNLQSVLLWEYNNLI